MSPTLRQPTTPAQAFAWYAETIAAVDACLRPSIDGEEPQPGFYKRRFDRAGVFVPARIWLVQYVQDGELVAPERLACEIGGEAFDPAEVWLALCGNPITKSEYDHLMRVRDWARTSRPSEPEAHPTKPIDLFTVAPPTWGRKSKRKQ